ncbi:MAG: ABC transporter ATP-binding protein [Methanobacteriota archaeon]|nr:MAG: ABC transporter ATP-binding protein [Euryarchaeota archaeon]
MPEVELRNVSKRFGRIVAVNTTNLKIEDGEYLSIVGPSGCGKTTLVKMISGVWEPSEGDVLIDGKKVNVVPTEDRDLGYVFQSIALFPHMTVWENTVYSPLVKDKSENERKSIGEDSLRLVNLLEKKGLFPSQLSGGAQQKVGLARALSSKAKLLILDEPLSALDARVRIDLRYELRKLVKRLGLTAIHVTHDQEEALSVADRTVVMRKGRIVEMGSPRQLYERPRHPFTANFVGEGNFLEGNIKSTSDNWCFVELRNQQFLSVRPTVARAGESVILFIRPENLRFTKEFKANALPGTVEDVQFVGSYLRYKVMLETEDIALIDLQIPHERINAGERVMVEFDPTDTIVYQRPPEGLREL